MGTLTSLNVANDATFNGTFYVKSAENKVGVNVSDPQATSEILSTSTQLRLTSQRGIFGIQDLEYTDLHTNTVGDFTITPSSNQTNIIGNANVSGDLVVQGSFTARTTDFNISADTLTFGDESTDVIIMNAQTITAPNDLEINNVLFVSASTVGVGSYSTSKFGVTSTSNQLQLGNGTQNLFVSVINGSTTISTNNVALDIANPTNVLGELVVGSNGDIVLGNAGQVSSSVSISSHSGYFTNLTSSAITNGNVSITQDNITLPTLEGTLSTPAQPNVTSLGTLTSLSVANAANITGNLSIGTNSTTRKVEIKDTNPQMRLTNTDAVFGLSSHTYADFHVQPSGDLSILPSSGKVIIPQLNLTNIQQGSSNNFLSLDQAGNVILAPAAQSGIEVRNRVVVTGNYSVAIDDYFVGIQATQNLTITLPNATSLFNGQIMVLKDELENADVYTITIQAPANQLVENRQSIILASPGTAINIYTDGASKFYIM